MPVTESRVSAPALPGWSRKRSWREHSNRYDPGPAVPLSVRLVVGKLPTKAPLTFNI